VDYLLLALAIAGFVLGSYELVKAITKVANGRHIHITRNKTGIYVETEFHGRHFFIGGFFLGASVVYAMALQGWANPHLLAVLIGLGSGVANLMYFAPSIVASNKSHPNSLAILALNLLLGWSFFGWAGALVWALMETNTDTKESRHIHTYVMPDDGKMSCKQCGRRMSSGFLCSDGRCPKCYQPSWGG
jgi:hypothetical protein